MSLISLKPETSELYTLNKFIMDVLGFENLQINLIVEEIFINIVNYSGCDYIKVNAEYDAETMTIEFIDNGAEFNPLLKENPKMPKSIDEAKIGGLGIFFTKEMSDEQYYHHTNDENHLKIIKKL